MLKKKLMKKSSAIAKPASVGLPTSPTTMAQDLKDYIFVIFGSPGVGKTTFVRDMADKVLFLSSDRGTRSMPAMRLECHNWAGYERAMTLLKKPGAPKYDLICLDLATDWGQAAETATLEELHIESLQEAPHGKGWQRYKGRLARYIADLKTLNTGLAFIAHEQDRKMVLQGVEIVRTQPDMSKNVWQYTIPVADFCGYCTVQAFKKGGKRVEKSIIVSRPTRDLYVKDRTQRVKPEAGWEVLDGRAFRQTFK